jgi:TP901 family phage tail tape measure protein
MAESLTFQFRAVDGGLSAAFRMIDADIARVVQRFTSIGPSATGSLGAAARSVTATATATGGFSAELDKLGKELTTARSGLGQVDAALGKLGTTATSTAGGLRQVDAGLKNTGGAADDTAAKTGGMSASFSTALKAGLAVGAGALGFTSLASGVVTVVGSMMDFETGMANVNTLVQNNVPLQEKLRAELLNLPPVLGTSTELSLGLYAALSAGVEPAKAVEFVGEAARTAKAGLTDMETSVNTLTSVMTAFGAEAGSVTNVSDILFQTVNVGKGSFSEFSGAFSAVSPLAKTLGISLKEVGATLGTLSFSAGSASQGGTALRTVMANLIQNMGKFRDIGIDVQAVISQEGLTGLFKRMQQATGGNIETIRELIPAVEGLSGALALMGAQAETQTKNLLAMGQASGTTAGAFVIQTATAAEAWKTFMATLDRLTQQVAPGVLGALTSVAAGLTTFATDVGGIGDAFTNSTAQEFSGWLDDLIFNQLPASVAEATRLTLGMQSLAEKSAAAAATKEQWQGGFEEPISRATTTVIAFNMEVAKTRDVAMAAAGGLQEQARQLSGFYDAVDTEFAGMNAQIAAIVPTIDLAFKTLGMTIGTTLTDTATQAVMAFQAIVASTASTPLQIEQAYAAMKAKVLAAYGTMPAEFGAVDAAIAAGNGALMRTLIGNLQTNIAGQTEMVQQLSVVWEGGVAKIVGHWVTLPARMQPANDALVAQAGTTAAAVVAPWQQASNALMAIYDATLASAKAMNAGIAASSATGASATQGAYDAALNAVSSMVKQTTVAVTTTVGEAVAELQGMSDFVTEQFGHMAAFTTQFATTETQLMRQIAGYEEAIRGLLRLGTGSMIGIGYVDAQMTQFGDALEILRRRLAALREPPGDNPPPPPGFAAGGLVPGNGPADSVSTLVSPGEFILPPDDVSTLMGLLSRALAPGRQAPSPGAPGASSGSVVNNTFQIVVHTTATNATALVRDLEPALMESIRRGRFTPFIKAGVA